MWPEISVHVKTQKHIFDVGGIQQIQQVKQIWKMLKQFYI